MGKCACYSLMLCTMITGEFFWICLTQMCKSNSSFSFWVLPAYFQSSLGSAAILGLKQDSEKALAEESTPLKSCVGCSKKGRFDEIWCVTLQDKEIQRAELQIWCRGMICLVEVVDGELVKGDKVTSVSSGRHHDIPKVQYPCSVYFTSHSFICFPSSSDCVNADLLH